MHIVAGCDGGGTKCAVRVASVSANSKSDLQTIDSSGISFSGGANVATDFETAIDNIAEATRAALSDMGLPHETRIESFVAALAGSTRIDHELLIARLKDRLNASNVSVVPDVSVLFAAAGVIPPAIATIVGTGSIAWLQSSSGAIFRSGGEGPKLGDFGSGYWIGRQAVEEGLAPADAVNTQSVSGLAELAPSIFSLAQDSSVSEDKRTAARRLLRRAAEHIARLVTDVAHQWKRNEEPTHDNPLPWVVAGGVAVHQTDWVHSIHQKCMAAGMQLAEPVLIQRPVDGALKMATSSAS